VKSKIPLDTLTVSIFDAIEEYGGKVYLVGGTGEISIAVKRLILMTLM
jgi:hypothetical protein